MSNADPKYTYRRLVGAEHLDGAFRRQVAQLKTHASYLKFHAALRELPDFSRYLGPDFDPRALAYIKICPSADYFAQSWDDARHGRPSRSPVMEVQIPTVYDPTLAPPGHHVMSIWVSYAPVQPRDGTWDTLRQPVGEHLIDTLATYAPNLREAIVDWSLFTPWDWSSAWASPTATSATSTSCRASSSPSARSPATPITAHPSRASTCAEPGRIPVAK